jgi:RNA polymerase sigma factor (TIGR02999 family)
MTPPSNGHGEITLYLKRLSAGDTSAEGPLADAVYAQLQRIARGLLQSESNEMSLQPTALVNGVLLELVRIQSVNWEDRAHFFRVASRLLRRRLIDYIREHRTAKYIPKNQRIDLDDLILPSEERFDEILFVNQGLDKLAKEDPPLAELIEMVYFGGVTIPMAAQMRKVSEKTIDRHLDLGRRWLKLQLDGPCPSFDVNSALLNRP